jgi:ParB family chromosome partitioning protein
VTRKRGLGKGLDALLGGRAAPEPVPVPVADATVVEPARSPGAPEAPAAAGGAVLQDVPVDRLRPGRYQPRRIMDEDALSELAESIRAQGVMQPIVVREAGETYEIIAGERRWRAATRAGLARVPVLVRQVDDQSAMALALIENIQREDLRPLEEAAALQRLLREFDLTQQQVADAVGKSRVAVTNLLRLLNLSAPVRELLDEGGLEMGHARALLGLPAPEQLALARTVVDQKLTVRETEKRVRTALDRARGRAAGDDDGAPSPASGPARDPDVARLEAALSDQLGAPVSIRQGPGGSGRLEIRFHSLDVLQGVLTKLGWSES